MESIPSEKDLKTEVVIMGHDERNARFNTNTTDPLTACDYKQPQIIAQVSNTGGGSENIVTDKKYAVRRLTPTECERLQSLPDGWTKIPHRSCSDSARYKALGNGMAQCCPTWLLKRLVKAVEECEE